MAAPHSHSSTLFMTREGAPMRFYIRPGPNKRQLAPLITHGGGVVSRIQEPGAFLLADPTEGHLGPGYISTTYINDCVSSNRSLSPRPYRLMPPRGQKTRADQRTFTSQLTAVHGAPGETEDHNERPAVDLTNNAEAAVQGHRENLTPTATTTEEATGEREDNMEKTSGKEEGHRRTSPASRRIISAEASSKSGEDLKPVEGTTSSKDGVRIETTNGDERDSKNSGGAAAAPADSTSSGSQKKPHSLRKMDVEQTLNEDENYSTLVIPDPRSSTPAPGNPNTVKDLETDTAHVSVLMKDGESPLETQFRRPKRKVAGKTTFGITEHQYSPNLKQKRAEKQADMYEKPKDEAEMSVHERHCGQAVRGSPIDRAQVSNLDSRGTQDQREEQPATEESHCAESLAGQMGHTTETETGTQYNAKELDEHSAEGHQVQSGFPPQGHKTAAALRRGRTAFTKEEDMAILLYIRDNVSSSCTVTGNALWMDMENKKVLARTWQAMKSRYVKYLTNKKHKYKLPPKNPSVPSKDQAERVQGSPKSNHSLLICTSTSAVTPKKCDTTLPSASADIPQNFHAIVPSTSAASPKKLDAMLPSASTDTPQKVDTMLPGASTDTPQKGDAMLSRASIDSPQSHDSMLPSASADDPQKWDTMLRSVSTDSPQKRGAMLTRASSDGPQKRGTRLTRASAASPQKWDTMLPSVSTDSPQKHATRLTRASADSPQKRDSMLSSGSADSPQKRDSMLPSGSADDPQKWDTMLPSVSSDIAQKCGAMLIRASTDGPQKRGAMLTRASTDGPQTRGAMLTRASADAHQSSSIKQHGAFPSNTLVANIASKERPILTPKKRSSDPTNDNESAAQHKGDRMLPSPPTDNTFLPDREDSGDSEALHIFERANMEFEETDDNASPQQPAPVVSQAKDSNKSASHVDETPSTSQASEGKGLREAMTDMMKEFKMDVSCVTQALFFNSGELGSTRHFLRTGARPDGYPIWEPEDDLDLKRNNPKMQSHLIQKYGADNVARRAAFLAG